MVIQTVLRVALLALILAWRRCHGQLVLDGGALMASTDGSLLTPVIFVDQLGGCRELLCCVPALP